MSARILPASNPPDVGTAMRQAIFATLLLTIFAIPTVMIADGKEFGREFRALVAAVEGNPASMKAVWFPRKVASASAVPFDAIDWVSAMGRRAAAHAATTAHSDRADDSGLVASAWVDALVGSLMDAASSAEEANTSIFVSTTPDAASDEPAPLKSVAYASPAALLNFDRVFSDVSATAAAALPTSVLIGALTPAAMPAGRIDDRIAADPSPVAPDDNQAAAPPESIPGVAAVDGGFTAALPAPASDAGLIDVTALSR